MRLALRTLLAVLSLVAPALAQQQPVITDPQNTGRGDSPFSAFNKLNRNDADLYSKFNALTGVVPQIGGDGRVRIPSGPTLGTYQNGKFTSQPDAVQIQGSGSTGDVSGMSVTASGSTNTLAARLPLLAPLASPVFTGTATVPVLNLTGSGSSGPIDGMNVTPSDLGSSRVLSTLANGLVFNIAWFVQASDNGDWGLACNRAVAAVLALPRGGEIHHSRGSFTYKTQCLLPKTSNKAIVFSGEGEGTVLTDNGQGAPILYAGASQDTFGGRVVFRDFMIQGVYNQTSQGIKLEWASNAVVDRVVFRDLWDAVTLTNSYAVTFNNCQDLYVQNRVYHSTTAAHKLTINGQVSNSSPATMAAIDVVSDIVTINDADGEGSGKLVKMPGGTTLRVRGGYFEYMTQNLFDFTGGTMVNAEIDIGWLSLGQGAGATQTFANMKNSRVRTGTSYNQAIAFDEATTSGIDATDQGFNLAGTSAITGLPTRWRTPTLLNSWAQQANFSAVRYRRTPSSEVIIEGQLVSGTQGTAVFTLPAGFRPSVIMDFATMSANGAVWVQVRPDGTVYAVTAASGTLGLNGIRFTATQ